MKKKTTGILLLLFSFFITQVETKAKKITLGIVLGFTGPTESIVPSMVSSAELAIEEANSSNIFLSGEGKINLMKIDTMCDKSKIGKVNKRINENDIVAIIGAACPGISEGILLGSVNEKKIPMISPSATTTLLSILDEKNLFFRTTPTNNRDGEVLAKVTKDRGIKRIAVSFQDSNYGKELERNFKKTLNDSNVEITVSVPIKINKVDLSNEVSVLAAAGGDAVAIFTEVQQDGERLIKSILDSGAFEKFIFSERMINESTEKKFGTIINNSFGIIPGSNSKNINSFYKIAQKNGIITSGPFIGESYDAAAVLILAIQEKKLKLNNKLSKNIMSVSNSPGTKIYPGEIEKGLKLIKKGKKINYEGATNIEFDINGDAFGTYLEKEIIKGKFKTRQQR
tara:strand:- start:1424 stop:2617 length:1194 start_codon:yes stop_codon:yes gene_type:complete